MDTAILLYVSIDIETDGPHPLLNSMRELCAVAYNAREQEVDSIDVIMSAAKEKTVNESTMTRFWAKHPEAWAYVTG